MTRNAVRDGAWSVNSIRSSLDAEATDFEADLRPVLPVALRLAAGMRLDRNDAEDAVQEAALRAWRKRDTRRPGTSLRPWFLAIVANQCRETRRARWASVLRFADPPVRHDSVRPDAAGTADLVNALRRLPADVRLAIVLRFYLDLPFEEVAAVSGCSADAAKSRVRRGVTALGALLRVSENVT